jgi:hypothetical protein
VSRIKIKRGNLKIAGLARLAAQSRRKSSCHNISIHSRDSLESVSVPSSSVRSGVLVLLSLEAFTLINQGRKEGGTIALQVYYRLRETYLFSTALISDCLLHAHYS